MYLLSDACIDVIGVNISIYGDAFIFVYFFVFCGLVVAVSHVELGAGYFPWVGSVGARLLSLASRRGVSPVSGSSRPRVCCVVVEMCKV
jgi:hypothetical protein